MRTLKIHLSEKVQKGLHRVDPRTLLNVKTDDPLLLLHISVDNKIRKFIPMVSTRGLATEDRTVPRVSTSVSITTCIAGAGYIDHYFNQDDFDGLFTIYGFDVDKVYVPSRTLVADATQNKETWLIGDDVPNSTYKAIKVGEFFIEGISKLRDKRRWNHTILVNVYKRGVWLTPDRYLEPGYYRVEGFNVEPKTKTFKMRAGMTITEVKTIDRATYLKGFTAYQHETLSVENNVMLRW